jgi:SAM-dependent methyltransferase
MKPTDYSFTRYLAAKKSIDDRSLNQHVWEQLAAALPPARPDNPLQVIEIGAGIGTMIERTLEWGLLHDADYTALDNQPENLAATSQRLAGWANSRNIEMRASPGQVLLEQDHHQVAVSLVHADVLDWIANQRAGQDAALHVAGPDADLLIAHAVLDLLDVPAVLPGLLGLLAPHGLFYFSLNFDGLTLLEPPVDPKLDDLIPVLYHRTMDKRLVNGKPSGDSRTGRHLFAHLQNAGAELLAAGASDWVVYPVQGSYPGDEAYFLHFILHTIHQALRGSPELDSFRLEKWVAQRHAQVERGELVYIAHQIDVLGRRHG